MKICRYCQVEVVAGRLFQGPVCRQYSVRLKTEALSGGFIIFPKPLPCSKNNRQDSQASEFSTCCKAVLNINPIFVYLTLFDYPISKVVNKEMNALSETDCDFEQRGSTRRRVNIPCALKISGAISLERLLEFKGLLPVCNYPLKSHGPKG